MKKLLVLLLVSLFLTACGETDQAASEPKREVKTEVKEEPKQEVEQEVKEKTKEETPAEETKNEIDTSVFEYAESVEVTDAIDVNQHVTVFVKMSDKTKPGLATQHVFNQTYNFLQQPDLAGAKTVTVAVKQGELKIAQITVNTELFVPNDKVPMSEVVLQASEVDSMSPEVKEYGTTMDTW